MVVLKLRNINSKCFKIISKVTLLSEFDLIKFKASQHKYIEKVMICAPCLSIEQFMKKRRNCKVFDNLLNRLSQSCPNISFTQLKKSI
ncbi:hypothetical protein BpHYR1_011540 [Brachionus plicatilis]|uniref:Uncharacterized protein n=1 Tax=Brachionus plicatilis TaxID=10195 RepID=A0A3M7QZS3_BRAPC|nr:hypothetical protein BpHYR1_011540 [Brachionus plicatilis]